MKIFGKTLSEYIKFQKYILILILIVGVGRLLLSLGGVADSSAKWLSVTAMMIIGTVYYGLRVYGSGFGSYKQLLPLNIIQNLLGELIVATGIAISIFTGKSNIFSAPEYSPSPEAGMTWGHALTHLIGGTIVLGLVGWLLSMLIMFIVRKLSSSSPAPAKA